MNTHARTAPRPQDSLINRLIHRAGFADERDFLLRVVQPGLVGLIDGTISSLAPIFAAAITSSSHTAFIVGLGVALGAGVSMGWSEAGSDTGEETGRGSARRLTNLFTLKKNNAGSRTWSRDASHLCRASGDLPIRTAFGLFVDARRKKARLAQLANCFVRGSGFKQSSRFLSPRVESHVVVLRHKRPR